MSAPAETPDDRRSRALAEMERFRRENPGSSPEDTDQFLAENPDLREILEGLLEETVTLSPESKPDSEAAGERAAGRGEMPAYIGNYRLIGVLGEGGMGIVYLAEQTVPVRREVAVKVIKLGMDTKDVLARFEVERQSLALMNHPAIAKVFDGGVTEQGQPYFVMEAVDGIPLTDFCDLYKLSLKARLQVMLKLCFGVQHAHQKSVLHRDLKPANILVSLSDGQIVVKIIDFGLARATDREAVEHSLYTQQGRIIGTPSYMSPEQAEGRSQDIDTRTDVYSLGVILYQVLTGELPFRNLDVRRVGLLEIYRIIKEDEPERPSTRVSSIGGGAADRAKKRRLSPAGLRKTLQGELDWIAMKAIAKDPERRYGSAMALAMDLQHYLRGEPVEAGPDSGVYRLRRLMRRYRVQVAIGGAALVMLLVSTVLLWGHAVGLFRPAQAAPMPSVGNPRDSAWRGRAMEQAALAAKERRRAELAQAATRHLQLLPRLSAARKAAPELAPRPSAAARLREWLREADALVGELPRIRLTMTQMEVEALPPEAPDGSGGPFVGLREQLRMVESLQRAQDRSEKRIAGPAHHLLEDDAGDGRPADLAAAAWRLVDPDRKPGAYGDEERGLALARRAAALPGGEEARVYQRTLAWALFANGLFAEARDAAAAALRLAPPAEEQEFRDALQRVERAIAGAPQALERARARLQELRGALPATDAAPSAAADRVLHRDLGAVVAALEDLAGPDGLRADVRQRLLWAENIEAWTRSHPRAQVTWAEVRAAVRAADGASASALYRPAALDLPPQLGLVPIGKNPATGLWEFYHLRSAWDARSDQPPGDLPIPVFRDDGSGALELPPGAGVVFALIPGGRFTMGRRAEARFPLQAIGGQPPPEALQARIFEWTADEVDAHEVELAPYFLARHELTRAQWGRLWQWRIPSPRPELAARERDLPVTEVSWRASDVVVRAFGLALPTEAQWEFACRAGTTSAWSAGDRLFDLHGAANLRDQEATEPGTLRDPFDRLPFSDGFPGLAPVGRQRPNAFGLFDMHGNVWEWCRDAYGGYDVEVAPGDGERVREELPAASRVLRVRRGGSFRSSAVAARSGARGSDPARQRSPDLGVRVARAVSR